jgi:hypothetical protein
VFVVEASIAPVVLFVATMETVPETVGRKFATGESMLTEPVLLTLTPPKTATLFSGKLIGVIARLIGTVWYADPLVPLAVRL